LLGGSFMSKTCQSGVSSGKVSVNGHYRFTSRFDWASHVQQLITYLSK
jgi:hypothetical protein